MDLTTLIPWLASALAFVLVLYLLFNLFSDKEWDEISRAEKMSPYGSTQSTFGLMVLIPLVVFFLASPWFKVSEEPLSRLKEFGRFLHSQDNALGYLAKSGYLYWIVFGSICLVAFVFNKLAMRVSKATNHSSLQISNLSRDVTTEQLEELLSNSGRVLSLEIQPDRKIALVNMESPSQAESAALMLNGQNLSGETIMVSRTRVDTPQISKRK